MKLMFASDIHGSKYWCQKMMERFVAERPQRLVLLGDLLYHGPRNDLPKEYDPKGVIALLNSIKENIIAVRGNCDAEVDQMVLEFPIMADFAPILLEDGRLLFCTHGHIYNNDKLPPLQDGDLLMNGHTHVYDNRDMGNYRYLNPGSVSLPKENCTNSYMIYHDGIFTLKDMDGNLL